MNSSSLVGLPHPLPASQDAVGYRSGFFTHHGAWAPGIRLFRKIGFRSKAALISVAFLLPLLALGWAYWESSQTSIDVARMEKAGVAVVARLEPWLVEVQRQRRLVISGAQQQVDVAAIDKVLKAMQTASANAPAELALTAALQPSLKAHDAVRQGASAATLQAYVDTLLQLRTTVLDRSGLTLDPDQDTYYLMAVSTDAISQVVESISRSRALAGDAEQRGTATPAELRELYAASHAGQQALGLVSAQIARAGEHNPSVRERMRPEAASQAAANFYRASESAWFGETFNGSHAALDGPGQAAVDNLRALGVNGLQLLDELLQARIDRINAARQFMLVLVSVSLLLAAYLFHSFYAVMKGGLAEVSRHLAAMTEGDLTTSPRPWGHDEAAQLMLLLAAMQSSLRGMVQQVRGASDDIVHSSSEIAEGAMDLSARTEQTAANLEQSSAAMEQISATVRQTADHAKEASTIAAHNAELAARGGQVIADMVQTMRGIHGASTRIADIIGVIDGIAFQTNILALNAAVEAARAGEQGRGFAVVANEVRSLANRSTEAAREIKQLITASVEQVEAGTTVASEAGGTIDQIVQSAARVNELLAQIAVGAHEQSQGVTQIGGAVQDLDQVTQQNAALVEETAAASSALKDQAHALAGEVARFRLPTGSEALMRHARDTVKVSDFDFDQAIEAHRQWKVRLRSAIAQHEQLDAATICRDDRCPLGQWLHGSGSQRWGGKPGFTALLERHREFHGAAGTVAEQINAGRYEQAERLLGSGSAFARASNEVTAALTRVKRGL